MTAEPDLIIERLLLTNRDDCDAVINLWYDAGLIEQNSNAQDDLRNCYESGRGSVLIARKAHKQAVIATVMVGHDGKSGWVHYLAVAPSLRGRGHGATMLDMAENILSHVGLEKCSVHAASERAAKFYRRQGYRLTTAPSRSSSTQDDRFYEKRLSS
ncbi:GNAT family N-acetyltransferase [Thalassospira sp. TSL5-1]|uniref:GNAT family N-acetyltransferase n=1 Tax=Thalassospira sp. TSL5-1 TaxID=1544451 RepID=UPI000A5AAFBA|nr:GNAT family N-acetyltransferase [Thalassospira sp. TSL5-1]